MYLFLKYTQMLLLFTEKTGLSGLILPLFCRCNKVTTLDNFSNP